MIPKCPYCENPAVLVTADEVGAHNDPRKYWRCKPCAAHIPCHTGTENPIGRLANAELREHLAKQPGEPQRRVEAENL